MHVKRRDSIIADAIAVFSDNELNNVCIAIN
jgi:hypothetical protein